MIPLKKLPKFEQLTPKTIQEACELLSRNGGEAKVMDGGTELLVQMKNREVVPSKITGLKNIASLKGIESNDLQGLKVGPLVTLHEIEASSLIKKCGILCPSDILHGLNSDKKYREYWREYLQCCVLGGYCG